MVAGNRVLAHQLDAAWIIALWKYVHDGDPPPPDQVIAAQIITALAGHLAGEAAVPPLETLQQRFAAIGSQITVEPAEAPRSATSAANPTLGVRWQYVEVCFGVPPNRHCVLVQLPRVAATSPG